MDTSHRWIVIFAALALGATSCADPRGDTPYGSCSAAQAKQILYGHMLDYYLWWDQMPQVSLDDYAGPEDLLDALRVNPPDRWSYLVPKAVDDAYYAGDGYIGVGLVTSVETDGTVRITEVYPNSPASDAGLVRGDVLESIGGVPASQLTTSDAWDAAWGPRTLGVAVTVAVRSMNGSVREVTLVKAEVVPPSVYFTTTFDAGGKTIGYLVLDRFIAPTTDELAAAFADFDTTGIDELIVDLRYNGGGYVSVARYLAELIGGVRTEGQLFTRLEFNSKHQDLNSNESFRAEPSALGLSRVVFITTSGTASASELVINGLKPFVDVVLVGSATHGKPVGMLPVSFCDLTLAPITFRIVNALGEGDYFDGLQPTCLAADDVTHVLGEASESSLAEALYYVTNDHCSPAGTPPTTLAPLAPAPRRELPLDGFARTVGAL